MAIRTTDRERAKADRSAALLDEAARLFAERGFGGVSLEDLGAAVGISGPAVYRHFASKQALLAAVLVRVSERLLEGGRRVAADTAGSAQLPALVRFHVDFAIGEPDVIRVQDRDLTSLADDDRRRVRRLQRAYVELWVDVLGRTHPDRSRDDLRVRAHACFGLINSTPFSVRAARGADHPDVRTVLETMAVAALSA